MARSGSAVFPVIREARAVKRVTPAEGPSLGVAPEGTWTWISLVMKLNPLSVPASRDRMRESEIVADSFITSPSWPVERELAGPGHECALDEEDLPPDRGPCKAGDYPGDRLLACNFLPDLFLAENCVEFVHGHDKWQFGFTGDNLLGDMPCCFRKLLFQPPYTCLAGIFLDDHFQCLVLETEFVRIEAVLL